MHVVVVDVVVVVVGGGGGEDYHGINFCKRGFNHPIAEGGSHPILKS